MRYLPVILICLILVIAAWPQGSVVSEEDASKPTFGGGCEAGLSTIVIVRDTVNRGEALCCNQSTLLWEYCDPPAKGADTNVQWNNIGRQDASSDFTFNDATGDVYLSGDLSVWGRDVTIGDQVNEDASICVGRSGSDSCLTWDEGGTWGSRWLTTGIFHIKPWIELDRDGGPPHFFFHRDGLPAAQLRLIGDPDDADSDGWMDAPVMHFTNAAANVDFLKISDNLLVVGEPDRNQDVCLNYDSDTNGAEPDAAVCYDASELELEHNTREMFEAEVAINDADYTEALNVAATDTDHAVPNSIGIGDDTIVLRTWLRAGDLDYLYADADPIPAWGEVSGQDGSQYGQAGTQPKLDKQNASINGNSAVEITSKTDMRDSNTPDSISGDFTIFYVYYPQTGGGFNFPVGDSQCTDLCGIRAANQDNGAASVNIYYDSASPTAVATSLDTDDDHHNGWHIGVIRRASNTHFYSHNGKDANSDGLLDDLGTSVSQAGALWYSTLFAIDNAVGGQSEEGSELAEVVVYEGALSNQEMADVYNYLANKYGFPTIGSFALKEPVDIQDSSGNTIARLSARGYLGLGTDDPLLPIHAVRDEECQLRLGTNPETYTDFCMGGGELRIAAATWHPQTASFEIGRDIDEDIFIYARNSDASKPYIYYDSGTGQWLVSHNGVDESPLASAGGSNQSVLFNNEGEIDGDTHFIYEHDGAGYITIPSNLDAGGTGTFTNQVTAERSSAAGNGEPNFQLHQKRDADTSWVSVASMRADVDWDTSGVVDLDTVEVTISEGDGNPDYLLLSQAGATVYGPVTTIGDGTELQVDLVGNVQGGSDPTIEFRSDGSNTLMALPPTTFLQLESQTVIMNNGGTHQGSLFWCDPDDVGIGGSGCYWQYLEPGPGDLYFHAGSDTDQTVQFHQFETFIYGTATTQYIVEDRSGTDYNLMLTRIEDNVSGCGGVRFESAEVTPVVFFEGYGCSAPEISIGDDADSDGSIALKQENLSIGRGVDEDICVTFDDATRDDTLCLVDADSALTVSGDLTVDGNTVSISTATGDPTVEFGAYDIYTDVSEGGLRAGANLTVTGIDRLIGINHAGFSDEGEDVYFIADPCDDLDSDGYPRCGISFYAANDTSYVNVLRAGFDDQHMQTYGLTIPHATDFLNAQMVAVYKGSDAYVVGLFKRLNIGSDLVILDEGGTDADSAGAEGYLVPDYGTKFYSNGVLSSSQDFLIPDTNGDGGTLSLASGANTSGATHWGDSDDSASDTGTEVCDRVGLTCLIAAELDGTEVACGTTATGVTASGVFHAFCY